MVVAIDAKHAGNGFAVCARGGQAAANRVLEWALRPDRGAGGFS